MIHAPLEDQATGPFVCEEEANAQDPAAVVAARLRRSGYSFLTRVSCKFSDGVLTLRGDVPTFYLKQIAQEFAKHTPGIRQVENSMHVSVKSGGH